MLKMIKKRSGKLIPKTMVRMLLVLAILFLHVNASQSRVLCISPDKCVSIEDSYDGRQCAQSRQSAQKSDSALPMIKSGEAGFHFHCIECVDIPLTFKLLSRKVSTLNPIKISHLRPADLFTSSLSVLNEGHGFEYLNGSTINPKLPISLLCTIVLLV